METDVTPPDYDAPNPRGIRIIIVNCVLTALATSIIAIRVFSRLRLSKFFGIDDWLMIAAWISSLVLLGIWIAYAMLGNGKHIQNIPPGNFTTLLKVLYANQAIYSIAPGLVKLSILTLYLRLFQFRYFRRLVHVSIVFIIAMTIAYIVAFALQCRPPSDFWNGTMQPHCSQQWHLMYSQAGLNLFTDLAILLMPMKYLWDSGYMISIWYSTELNLAMIAASLPACRHFYQRFIHQPIASNIRSSKSRLSSGISSSSANPTDTHVTFREKAPHGENSREQQTLSSGQQTTASSIHISTSFEVDFYDRLNDGNNNKRSDEGLRMANG